MDFRALQDNEMRTSASLSYAAPTHHHHLSTTKESSSSSPAAAAAAGGSADHQKRRVGIHNGTSNYTTPHPQTLDHPPPHHIQQPQQQQLPLQPLIRDPPDPDRALAGTPVAPAGLGSGGHKSSSKVVRYRECLKNHAANIGGNVFDGCGEFMPSGEEGTLEALKCAACDCHRNFHRKEVDGETTAFSPGSRRSSIMLSPLQLPPPLPSPSSALHHHHHHHHQKFAIAPIIQPMNVAFGSGGGGGTESSSEDLNVFQSNNNVEGGGVPLPPFSLSKKRFRTKFTQEQKEKMMEFAEKVGWRIQKQDEEEVERFCTEVGVKRQVLRVWMHNNKNSIKNRNDSFQTATTTTTSLSFENVEGEGGAAADDDA